MIRLADHNLYQVKKNCRKDICGSSFQPIFLNMSKKKQRESLICFHAVFFARKYFLLVG